MVRRKMICPKTPAVQPDQYKWAFDRAIEYIKKGDLRNACVTYKLEMIRIIAGFAQAPPEIVKFYENPAAALQ